MSLTMMARCFVRFVLAVGRSAVRLSAYASLGPRHVRAVGTLNFTAENQRLCVWTEPKLCWTYWTVAISPVGGFG